jgi:predicted phage-related endonuclease
LYNETTNTEAYEVGFTTEEIAPGVTLGYSPDGLVGEDGLIEIKSRCQKYQMQTIAANIAPAEYMLQMQTGMLVTGRKWCDFVSYCGGMPLFIKRVYPDADMQAAIVAATVALEDKINELIAAYTENCKGMPVAPRIDYNNEIEL